MEEFRLSESEINKMTEAEAKETLLHIRSQFQTCYNYIVGYWAEGKHVRSTRDGKMVDKNEVIKWLSE